MKKQVFDKKEESILRLDELFKGIGEEVRIANQVALKEHGDSLTMLKETKKLHRNWA
ncbi:hypothetical protein SPONN_838 [uncultured Candidatus Thioglobus sp.]|nr:hypothetical protein SPONN_1415 [uncultured Candidatus Thioglobus sp.]SMM99659.1 hypothetical protein SPONN_838 [uncultured Candidatus Thioglobus sp.]SMN01810.1 hypothetical protein SPONL_103 [uncultured Candidatus Thioglobus sp.]